MGCSPRAALALAGIKSEPMRSAQAAAKQTNTASLTNDHRLPLTNWNACKSMVFSAPDETPLSVIALVTDNIALV
jgi:hypothetical protein